MPNLGPHLGQLLLAATTTTVPINIAGLTALLEKVVGLLVVAGGAVIMAKAWKQRSIPDALGSGAVLLIGMVIFGLALSGNLNSVSQSLASLFFG